MELTAYSHVFPKDRDLPRKILLAMKLTTIFILAATLHLSASTYAQRVSLSVKDKPITEVFKIIGRQTGYEFIVNPALVGNTTVSLTVQDAPLEQVLTPLLKEKGLDYTIKYNTIVVTAASVTTQPVMASPPLVTYEFKGRVTDSTGAPLSGATVTVLETKNAVQTDKNGIFTIRDTVRFPTLVISFIGYAPRELKLQKNSSPLLFVILRSSNDPLDEIQVTAYGRTSKRLSTGDITTITSEEIERNPVPNVLQALQGLVPGLFITQQTGQPGGAFSVQVRSQTVLAPANSVAAQMSGPLFVVDGVTYPAGEPLPMIPNGAPLGGGNALNYLDPSLMESVTVLKGPDATAIYGSRGAGGVIIITTKKGVSGKPRLNMNVYTGATTYGPGPQLLNTKQYLALRHNAFANDGTKPASYDHDVNGDWDTTSFINWRKFYQGHPALTTKANAAYSGGSNNTTFLIGANYSDQGNIQRGLGSVRMGGMNFNVTSTTGDRKFSILLSGNYSDNLNNMVPLDASPDILAAPDAAPYYLPNGVVNWAGGSVLGDALASLYKNRTDNLLANTVLTYTPVTGLNIKLSAGYTRLSAKEFQALPSAYFPPASFTPNLVTSTINYYSISTLTLDPNISYKHRLGRKGTIDVTTGGTIQNETDDNFSIQGRSGFLSDNLLYDPASVPIANQITRYSQTPYRYLGFFAVAHYNWDNKYILNLNGRRDGSTRFGPGKQFGDFGSVGAAWVISEEKWFKALRSIIDFAKLTGSYGTTGGQSIPNYQYLNTYSVYSSATYQNNTTLTPNYPANPDLHWSTNTDMDLGGMLGFLKGRINVEGTWYHNTTSGLLQSIPLSSVTGITSRAVYQNSPIVINTSGLELTMSTINIRTSAFSWETQVNVTVPHSKLAAFPGGPTQLKAQFGASYIIGKPITGGLMYTYKGVDPATGRYFFTNAQGVTGPFNSSSATLNGNDANQFRDFAPKFYGSISNTIRYKQFNLSFLFTFTDRIAGSYQSTETFLPGAANNFPTLVLNRWMKPGDKTTVPAATTNLSAGLKSAGNFRASTGSIANATYARLANMNIAYSLPPSLLKKAHLAAMKVYLAGQNLLTISRYGGLDPENLSANTLGPLRVFTAGINFTF